ncbi:hypothetical protein HGRIS_011111 [Hohenbuehelia grisea]|uniref:RING-type E3 ubiquitin transferase n=1 Tax=Hohenbuehelia grisea TaxID=104357 RepID=A0ABR3IZA1_9AGAR
MSNDGDGGAPSAKRIKLESSPSPPLDAAVEPEAEVVDEDHCAICLQPVDDRTVVPGCSHEFCFECLQIWSEQSRRCPLCSQNIGEYLIHNIRSKYDYQKHYLAPLRSSPPQLQGSLSSITDVRREYRRAARERVWGRRRRQEREEADRFDQAIIRRKWIYQHDFYAKHVASNGFTRYRPYPTPAQFAASSDYISRTTAFLRRELQVWPNLDVEFLTTFIISIMKAIDIRSESAVKLLAEFLDLDAPYVEGDRHVNAEHFAHEVYSYVRSPYKDLFVYDSVVQYDVPPDVAPPPERTRGRRWYASQSRSRSPPPQSPRLQSDRRYPRSRSRSRSRSMSWSPSGRRIASTREPSRPHPRSAHSRHEYEDVRSSRDHERRRRPISPKPSRSSKLRHHRVRDRSGTYESDNDGQFEVKVHDRVQSPSVVAQNGYTDPKGKRKADEGRRGWQEDSCSKDNDGPTPVASKEMGAQPPPGGGTQLTLPHNRAVGTSISNAATSRGALPFDLALNTSHSGTGVNLGRASGDPGSHVARTNTEHRRAPGRRNLLESVQSHLARGARPNHAVARTSDGEVDQAKLGNGVGLASRVRPSAGATSLLSRLSDPQPEGNRTPGTTALPRSAPDLGDGVLSSSSPTDPLITPNEEQHASPVAGGHFEVHHSGMKTKLSAPEIMARTRARLGGRLKNGDVTPHHSHPPLVPLETTNDASQSDGALSEAKASKFDSAATIGHGSRASHLTRGIDDPTSCDQPSLSDGDKNTVQREPQPVVVEAEDPCSACALTTEPTVSASLDLRARLMSKLAEQKRVAVAEALNTGNTQLKNHAAQALASDDDRFFPIDTRTTTDGTHPHSVTLQDPAAMESALRTRAKLRVRLAAAKRASMGSPAAPPDG